ncbi:CapA family protein [Chloroflexota bacterium]
MTEDKEITFIAVGDFNLNRDKPESTFIYTAPILRDADITFGQLEAAISDRPSKQVHAPSACCVPTKNASGLTHAGFDVISFDSNHTLDVGVDALKDTIDIVKKNNIGMIGVGMDIEEARRPLILERKGTKIGFLAYNSVLPPGYAAGPGRPGCNPIRVSTFYDQVDAQPGTPPEVVTIPNREDVKAMEESIQSLKSQVDIVMISMHWGIHFQPAVIAMYQREVGHAAIDAGADLIIGTHAHILKGIEVYKGKVIFYSLCNFGMDAFLAREVKSPHAQRFFSLYKFKPDPEYTTYPFPPDAKKSMIAKCKIVNGNIASVSYLPLWINKQSQPELPLRKDKRSEEVYNYVEWLCQDQELDTKFSWDGDEVAILT